jgi:hypothetical protein
LRVTEAWLTSLGTSDDARSCRNQQGEEHLDNYIAAGHTNSIDNLERRRRLAAPTAAASQTTFRLGKTEALLVILAASLGLWAAIAAAAISLAPILVP